MNALTLEHEKWALLIDLIVPAYLPYGIKIFSNILCLPDVTICTFTSVQTLASHVTIAEANTQVIVYHNYKLPGIQL